MMSSEFFTTWFLPGIWVTVQVTVYAAALGAAIAFGIGLARGSRHWIVRFVAGIYFEVFRGSLAAVTPAQKEAGIALNFTRWQRLRLIELPQAWPEMVPPFNNLLIELLKGTALVSVITVADMTFAGNLLRLGTNETTPVYTLLLVLYFVLAFLITRGMRLLERRAKAGIGQRPEKSGGIGRKPVARDESLGAGSQSQSHSQSAGGTA
jgi:polar amino acid transport system permease protein